MELARAMTKYVRISPRKARYAAALIRNLDVENAFAQLKFSPLRGAKLLYKTLQSAVANAETQCEARREDMWVFEVRVDAGPILRRAKARSRGSSTPVNKRTSHFTVIVAAEEDL